MTASARKTAPHSRIHTYCEFATDKLDAAEAANMFLPIGNDPTNQYEIDTGNVLICPLIAPDA